MLSGWVIGLVIVVCVIGGLITLRVLKVEENKQQKYEERGETAKGELERSLEYEEKSLHKNVPRLTWIYVVATLLSIIALVVYMSVRN